MASNKQGKMVGPPRCIVLASSVCAWLTLNLSVADGIRMLSPTGDAVSPVRLPSSA